MTRTQYDELTPGQKEVVDALSTDQWKGPTAIAVQCGKGLSRGSPDSNWAFTRLKTLLRKGLVERSPVEGYRLKDTDHLLTIQPPS